ncbi:MAG: GNAT family N-acetyltransferase [Bacteroidota bacterium]
MFTRSDHIYLRALESSDLETIYASENDPGIWKVSNTLTPYSKDVLELYLQTAHQDIYVNKQLRLMICLNLTNEPVGTIDLFEFDPMHFRVGVGVLIFEAFRKRGYASEAIELVKKYTCETLLMNQLFCNISSSNNESVSLFEKCGFNKVGIKKQWNRVAANQFEDEWMYQLIF